MLNKKRKKRINPGRDFFDGKFIGKPIIPKKDSEQRKKFVNDLLLARQGIEKVFIGLEVKGEKWLHYLGNEVYESKFIHYCCNTDTGCPLVAKLYPPPATPVGL